MQYRIFIFIYFTHLGYLSTLDPKTVKTRYLEYVITVVEHIRIQEGWNSMKHLQLNHDEYKNVTIKKVFAQKIDKMNITDMLSIVVGLLNYKYTQILKNYVEIVTLSIRECEKYSTDNLLKEFIDCTRRIEYAVKNSKIMFDNLYQVMTFMSYLDIKWLNANISGNPFVKVEEIYFAYNYINIMEISDQSFYIDQYGNYIPENATSVLLNIKTFVEHLYFMTENGEENNCILAELPVPINYNLFFKEEYLNFKSLNPHLSTFDFVIMMLDSFCNITIQNEYENLGFEKILNPLLYKCTSLCVPPFDPISQEKGIMYLNFLLKEGNWKTVENLYIKHNDQLLSANRVLRDYANNNNFRLKMQYFTLLLRCRFFDLLKKFTSHLHGTVKCCKRDNFFMEVKNNPFKFTDCVKNVFMAISNSQVFLNCLNTAMDKLEKAKIWHGNGFYYCLSVIKNIVENILDLIQEKNLLQNIFANPEIPYIKEVVEKYYDNAMYVISSLKIMITNGKRINNKHCFYYEKPYNFKKAVLKNDETSISKNNGSCQQAFEELNMYCEDFVINEYKNLGFDKI
ncbi:uncharacterized protein LOC126907277 isoform X1 [Daktulosphaira vitifoliae]|uniref:uncharacterized protein LOC126907277 isoform X1 n=2 Tax=Daktulosphaira vitifoliae TaxID=58002 RepID=UPI0021A9C2F9|nr:uncharacterized protein LOC126907277 isoform X1 [Daktulosphaira vitifoliae]